MVQVSLDAARDKMVADRGSLTPGKFPFLDRVPSKLELTLIKVDTVMFWIES